MGTEAGATLLAVDDDDRVLATYRRGFEARYRVLTAMTSSDAAELATREPPSIAVLDLHLQEGSTISLVRTLRLRYPALRIALVSGYLTTDATVMAVKAGADLVLDKPIVPREILRRLETQAANDIDRAATPTLAEAINAHIARVLGDCDGNISETARRLGIHRSSLQRRLRRLIPKA